MRKLAFILVGFAGLGVAACGATSEQYEADRKTFCERKGLAVGTQEFRECVARQLHFQHKVGAGAPVQYRRHRWEEDIVED